MHIQTHARVFTQAHMCTQTQIGMQNIKWKSGTNTMAFVMPSTAGWIYWLLCGMQIHPSCKNVLSGLLSSCALALRWSLSTSNAFLSSHYNQSAGSDLEPGWLAQLTPECWLRARSSVQSTASLWGENRGRRGAIWGATEVREHPVFKLHWARFSCDNVINFLKSLCWLQA